MTATPATHRDRVHVITAFDLDRTLVFSPAAAGDAADLPAMEVVEALDGAPLSRMTARAWQMLAALMQAAEVVPVTTRTPDHYAQIVLPQTPHYALCANGGVLLVDGVRDPEWDNWSRSLVEACAPLDDVLGAMRDAVRAGWAWEANPAEGLFCYLTANSRPDIPARWLAEFTAFATGGGWTVSVQGRKVYAVPAGLSKATGILRLREQIASAQRAPVRLYAAGDSLLDAPMLEAADAAIRPAHGELHEQGYEVDGVDVTDASGALAGEEIIGWMRAKADAPTL